jgi:hypothetical protein
VTLIPECLDNFIGEDNPVRVADVFAQELDLCALGFKGTMAELQIAAAEAHKAGRKVAADATTPEGIRSVVAAQEGLRDPLTSHSVARSPQVRRSVAQMDPDP